MNFDKYLKQDMTDTQDKITNILYAIKEMLLYKNEKYGDSALNPKNIFYKGDATNSILIRIDDKLGRITNNKGELRVNDITDLIGYLTLLLVSIDANEEDILKLMD